VKNVRDVLVSPSISIRELLERIDRAAIGIALVVDQDDRLIDTITDGDVRRAILAALDVSLPVQRLIDTKDRGSLAAPLTSPVGSSDAELLHLMRAFSVRHIPLVDHRGRVVDVALLSDLVKEPDRPLTAVVMAGGFGTRLRPLTDDVPKPMLPIGDRPLLAHIIGQLRAAGIRQLNVTTHYKADAISDHFGNGEHFGVDIRYVHEDLPLGTAGALALVEATDQPLLVMNGDILTRVDFGAMHDFHRQHGADMTVGVRQYQIKVPYGVVETDAVVVTGVSEKPTISHFINAGLYLINPDVRTLVPDGRRFDMTDLIHEAIARGRRVVCFPIREYWLDIGQMTDYERAQIDVDAHSSRVRQP
jgi:dTDP-glucose pyrophosphorylase/CBS domain-containing protein